MQTFIQKHFPLCQTVPFRFISHKFGARVVRRLSNTNLMAYYKHFEHFIWHSEHNLRMRKLLLPTATPKKKLMRPTDASILGVLLRHLVLRSSRAQNWATEFRISRWNFFRNSSDYWPHSDWGNLSLLITPQNGSRKWCSSSDWKFLAVNYVLYQINRYSSNLVFFNKHHITYEYNK